VFNGFERCGAETTVIDWQVHRGFMNIAAA
jgi:hypothetical protein